MVVQSYDEAMAIVDREIGSHWEADGGERGPAYGGTWYVSPQGGEDEQGYLVPAGSWEWLIDRNEDYRIIPGLCLEVVKATGEVAQIDKFDPRILGMTPVWASYADRLHPPGPWDHPGGA